LGLHAVAGVVMVAKYALAVPPRESGCPRARAM
jgi:hypothetical protein